MTEQIAKAPIIFTPNLKTVIWGGAKICGYKGIPQTKSKVGESWEISAIPGHESVVAEGIYKGLKITELSARYGESLLGSKVVGLYGRNFPLLVKIIDAADKLSVQVHPGDALARKRHKCMGKDEMWYVISAEPGAKILSGLKVKLTPDEYERRVADGSFEETIAVHDSKPGDVYFLPAGRVHSIGAGNLLAEIQQSSDITYRIYDYDRRDSDGNLRELHTSMAKDAIDFHVYDHYKNPPVDDSVKEVELVNCEHFSTKRIILDEKRTFNLPDDSFTIIMCISGSYEIDSPEGKTHVKGGETILLPANIGSVSLDGDALLLTARV